MSTQKPTTVEQLEALIDAYLEDLQETPDESLVSDADQDAAQSATFRKLVEYATTEAGRRRLVRAKRAIETKAQDTSATGSIDVAAARRYLVEAANDPQVTLAARDLREISDEEVIRLYLQLKELEAKRIDRKD